METSLEEMSVDSEHGPSVSAPPVQGTKYDGRELRPLLTY
jgi:hypothetical protein